MCSTQRAVVPIIECDRVGGAAWIGTINPIWLNITGYFNHFTGVW